MSDIDLDKLKSMNFALPEYDLRPMQSHIAQLNRQQEQTIRAIEQARAEKEAEELRRHNEIVAALKEAGEKGATIVVGDNAKDVQIQQNTTGSTQVIQKAEELDYERSKTFLLKSANTLHYHNFSPHLEEIVITSNPLLRKHWMQ